MIEATHHFPGGFLWGTATSSHQVEGDNENNDWWAWELQPGRILGGHRSGKACGWWEGKWAEDFDRAAKGHQNAHRLSLAWSRIEPVEGTWSDQALAAYREILEGAIERGLTPMVTLHHFTHPQWFLEQGGWLHEGAVELFARYVQVVVDSLGDLADLWVTINEPNVYYYAAYVEGVFPPGHRSLPEALHVASALVRAHGAAYRVIHQALEDAHVGMAHHYRGMAPAKPKSPLDRAVVGLRHRLFNLLVPEALSTGILRLPWKRETHPEVKGTQDFFGLNYYTREQVAFRPTRWQQGFGWGFFDAEADLSPNGFIANDPEGFFEALKWAHSYDLPIYVTENGVEDDREALRPRYLASHIRHLWRAVNFNWRVKGYFHWSLVDNFEWERGWTQRFGLWALDPATQERTRRRSADLYAEICETNGLSSQMVATYAPEIHAEMFPAQGPGEMA